jgi:hypothetical protein
MHLKDALEASTVLERPAPTKIPSQKLRFLRRVCGLNNLFEVDEEVVLST